MFITLRKAKLVFLGVAASQLPVFLSMCWNEARAAEPVGAAKNAYKEKKVEIKASDVQKGKVSDKKAEGKGEQNAEAKGDKKAKGDKPRRAREAVLVPPPPPATPSFLPEQLSDLGEIGPLEFLSKDDLKFKLENLNKKLAAAKADQKDQAELTKEIKGKAERFDSLFAEGVVSKRELETSKKEAERSERDLERTNIKVAEYQRMTETVQERLTKVEAASKPKAAKAIARKAVPVRKKKTAIDKKIAN